MSEETTPSPATPVQRGMDLLSNAAIAIAVAALLGLVVVQGWQVIARYVINDSPSWTEPVTVLLLTTAMSLGAAAGVHTNRHFGFFLLADAVGPRLKKALHAVSPLVIAAIGAVMAYWGAVLLPMTKPSTRALRAAIVFTVFLLGFNAMNFGIRNGLWMLVLILFAATYWTMHSHELSQPMEKETDEMEPEPA